MVIEFDCIHFLVFEALFKLRGIVRSVLRIDAADAKTSGKHTEDDSSNLRQYLATSWREQRGRVSQGISCPRHSRLMASLFR